VIIEEIAKGEGLRTVVRFGLTPRHPPIGPIVFRDR
jgi:hypothetical protein